MTEPNKKKLYESPEAKTVIFTAEKYLQLPKTSNENPEQGNDLDPDDWDDLP